MLMEPVEEISDFKEAVDTGTTIIAVVYKGGVLMAADTRTATGSYVANRASRKISKVHDRIFVCRCGSAADTQMVTRLVKRVTQQISTELGELPQVVSIANLFRLICYRNKNNLSAHVIVGGYDPIKGGQVFSISGGGAMLPLKYACDGSGSGPIKGLLDHLYRDDMSREECRNFVTKCVAHAIARDGSSGGMIRLVDVTEDGVVVENIEGDKLPFGPL
eukprot:GHVR01147522.1.p1 GENE.GHVR01147522.1~~GHVR01147522.1.p1  ORF type:complete len:226 (+),score=60.53 GHVR01147522.1:23-679(+)